MDKKIKIAPSILAADFSKLGEEISAITVAGADYVHVDVMYGKSHSYGPNCTWVMASGGPEHINSDGETVPALNVAPGESVVFTFADFLMV